MAVYQAYCSEVQDPPLSFLETSTEAVVGGLEQNKRRE
jgi:hypothetical protein